MNYRQTELYGKFYNKYNKYRDKLILRYLRYLKKKHKPGTKGYDRWVKLSTAYWNTRLANRPFIKAKPEYIARETETSRKAWLAHSTQRPFNPNEYKGGYK